MKVLGVNQQTRERVLLVTPGEWDAMAAMQRRLDPPWPIDDGRELDWAFLFSFLRAVADGKALEVSRRFMATDAVIQVENQ